MKRLFYFYSLLALLFFASSYRILAGDSNLYIGETSTEDIIYTGSDTNWDTIFIGPTTYSYNHLGLEYATYSANGVSIGSSSASIGNNLFIANATFTISGTYNVYIGYSNSSFNSMKVSDNSACYNYSGLYVGAGTGGASSDYNTLTVDAGATWNNYSTASPYIGYYGNGNQLIISNATFNLASPGNLANNIYIGYNGNDNNVSLLNGGTLNALETMYVGYNGSGNSFVVNNSEINYIYTSLLVGNNSGDSNRVIVSGSTLNVNGSVYLGAGTGGNNDILLRDGATMTVFQSVFVGYEGNSNSLIVGSNSTLNLNGDLIIGNNSGNNNSVLINGGLLSSTGNIYAGYQANNNSLIVSNTGSLITTESGAVAFIGYSGSNNSFLVTGSGSSVNITNAIYVGYGGSISNNLTISDSAQVALSYLTIGNSSTDINNSAIVTSNGYLTVNDNIYVGNYGSSNSLIVSNGGTIFIPDPSGNTGIHIILGNEAGANNNNLIVSGGTINDQSSLYVGYYGNNNSLIITNGGSVTASIIYLLSLSNSLSVTGSNSALNAGEINVGTLGAFNTATISQGGKAFVDFIVVGDAYSSRDNLVIKDTNSSLYIDSLDIGGYAANNNNCIISNGATLIASNAVFIGSSSYSSTNSLGSDFNTLIVTGSNSLLECSPSSTNPSNSLYIGAAGAYNDLIITNGGTVIAGMAAIGFTNQAVNNHLIVDGLGSSLSVENTNYYSFVVGVYGSTNELIVRNEGKVSTSFSVIGYTNSAINNTALVTDPGSTWSNNNNLYIGFLGNSNNLIISNGGQVFVSGITQGSVFLGASYIGLASAGNSVNVTGEGSLFSNSAGLYIGNIGSNNSLIISNGGKVVDSEVITTNIITSKGITTTNYTTNYAAYIGWASGYAGSSATITGSNSLWTNNGDLAVGYGSYGNTMTISNGGTVFDTTAYIGYSTTSSNNTVIVTGAASLWTNTESIYLGNGSSGNTLLVTDGGTVSSANFTLGNTGFNNSVTVADGTLLASNTYINNGNGSNNTILITGSNALMSNTGIIAIGNNNISGFMSISNNATVIADEGIFINNGTLNSYGDNSLNDIITLGGGPDIARLFIEGNLTMPSFTWGTNGFIVMQMGSGTLSVTSIINMPGGGGFDFSEKSLNNNSNLLLTVDSGIGNYNYYARGMNGITFVTNGNTLSEYIATNANFITYVPINQTNILDVANFTFSGDGVTNIITTNGTTLNGQILTPKDTGVVIITNSPNTANVTVVNNGVMQGNGLLILPDCTLKGNGTNDFTYTTNWGTLSPGNSPGTLHFSGNLTLEDSSVIIQELAGAKIDQYDHVTARGNIMLGGALDIRFVDDVDGRGYIYIPNYGDLFKAIIIGTKGITGSFTSIIAPKDYRGRLLYENENDKIPTEYLIPPLTYTSIDLLIAPSSYTLLAQNQNQYNVAEALNSFIPAASGDQLTVSVALDHLTASEYPTAFNQIMPSLYQSLSTIAFNVANGQDNELMQRLGALRIAGTGFTMNGFPDNTAFLQEAPEKQSVNNNDILRPGVDKHWGVFIDGNGIFAQANSGNMLPNYNTESGGATTGVSYQWNNHFSTGLYTGYQGGYTKYNANANAASGSLVNNAVRFGLFGSYGESDGVGLYANTLLGGGYNCYTMQRTINFGTIDRTATGMPQAGELDSMLGLGYDRRKGPWTFGPTMGLQYTYFGVNPFSENGAQSLDLSTAGWNTSSMIYSLGSHAAYNWQANKNLLVIPQLSLGWQYEFLQNPYAINSTLGSATFANWSSTPQRSSLFTGVGVTVELSKKWDLSFFYNALAGNPDMVSQNIFLSAGMHF